MGVAIRKTHIRTLVELGIIETNGHYVMGGSSKGYRFTEKYQNAKFRLVAILPEWQLSINLNRPALRHEPDNVAHAFLCDNLKRVTIDNSVDEFLKEFECESIRQCDFYERTVEFYREKEFFFCCHRKTGRCFYNVTSTPRALRPFLRLDGKPLVEIDVANCQPFLLLGLYDDEPEKVRFKEWVERGRFYEHLAAEFGIRLDDRRNSEKVQESILVFLFDHNRPTHHKYAAIFADQFPVLLSKNHRFKRISIIAISRCACNRMRQQLSLARS